MRRRERLSLILALALMAGQWLSAAHGPEHLLQADAAHCAVCVFSDASGTGALASTGAILLFAAAEAPYAGHSPVSAAFAPGRPPIRGPPVALV